jgi:hypothetical protein
VSVIRLGTFTPSVLLRVARRTGRLSAAGLEVSEQPVPSSPDQFAALLAGTLDAVLTSPDNVLAYRYTTANPLGRTADVRILSALDRGMGLALYSRLSPTQLRGRMFGVDVPASGFAFAMFALAASLGLGRDDYRVTALGSTPKRLTALLAGECDATMLNAGNELHAERAGVPALARVSEVCGPYLGTVLAVLQPAPGLPDGADDPGPGGLRPHHALAATLTETAAAICAGELDAEVVAEAQEALRLDEPMAKRYLERLCSPTEGLVPDGVVDLAAVRTLVDLRRRYGPATEGDPYAPALIPGSGLFYDRT